jgi:acetate kinase
MSRRLTMDDIELIATVSGDSNAVHLDKRYAADSRHHKIIAHGMWSGALVSGVLARTHPDPAQAACFDTAFHSTQPWVARSFALPRTLTAEGVCRYGFHGMSYEDVTQQLLALQPELAKAHIVICHLGNCSSLCAAKGGRSMDSSMGFTAPDGVPMGTRSGSIDLGVILHLMREKRMDLDTIEGLL